MESKIRKDLEKVFGLILKTKGIDYQMRLTQEECAELIVAISHVYRDNRETNLDEFIEELADVYIMVRQLIYYLENNRFGDDFWKQVNGKLERLLHRIENNTA